MILAGLTLEDIILKINKFMKNILFFCVILFFSFLVGCSSQNDKEFDELLAAEDANPPYSNRENEFFDSIQKSTGFHVDRKRTFIGFKGKDQMYYSVRMENKNVLLDSVNYKTYLKIKDQVIKCLYQDVIEDSVLKDMSHLTISYEFGKYPKTNSMIPENFEDTSRILHSNYSIDELIKKFGR